MKKLLLSVVVATACLSVNATAAMQGTKQFKFVGDTEFAGFCEAIVMNDLELFKKNIAKQAAVMGISRRQTLNAVMDPRTVTCADSGLLSFAQQRNATEVLALISGAVDVAPEQVAQVKYKFVGNTKFASFCKAALTNNVDLFKRSVKNQVGILATTTNEVMSLVLDSNNVTCAGQGLREFSEERQATDVANYIGNVKA